MGKYLILVLPILFIYKVVAMVAYEGRLDRGNPPRKCEGRTHLQTELWRKGATSIAPLIRFK